MHTQLIGCTGKSPRDCVMTCRATTRLTQAAEYGKARIVEIQIRQLLFKFTAIKHRCIRTMHEHSVRTTNKAVSLGVRVVKINDTTLTHHHVVVDFLLKAFPQLKRPLIKGLVAIQQIIGSNDGCITTRVSTPNPAFFKDRDVANTMFARKVISRRQTVPAATDDYNIVGCLRFRARPGPRPSAVFAKGLSKQLQCGIFHALFLGSHVTDATP